VAQRKLFAVVGAGPAGLACAAALAERGHAVSLIDRAQTIGGQFNYAKRIPGKEEFHETLRYFHHQLADTGVSVYLGQAGSAASLRAGGFDEVVIATGITPRQVHFPGSDDPRVLGYLDVLAHDRPVGPRVAIIGAGGIGFDVAEFLVENAPSPATDVKRWTREWGVDMQLAHRAGLQPAAPEPPARQVWLLQRSEGRPGARLNKTTGWVHRATLKNKRVTMLGGVAYQRFDNEGLHITVDGKAQVLPVDNVVICPGQEPNRALADALTAAGIRAHIIGGADVAAELDAKRAIAQGTRLASQL
jgi:2,4-dienoyl-CoA reductase (NADPH2)